MVMTYDLSENSKHRKTIKFSRISTGIASALKFLFGPRQSILELGSLDRNNTRFEMCPICQYCALCVEKKRRNFKFAKIGQSLSDNKQNLSAICATSSNNSTSQSSVNSIGECYALLTAWVNVGMKGWTLLPTDRFFSIRKWLIFSNWQLFVNAEADISLIEREEKRRSLQTAPGSLRIKHKYVFLWSALIDTWDLHFPEFS